MEICLKNVTTQHGTPARGRPRVPFSAPESQNIFSVSCIQRMEVHLLAASPLRGSSYSPFQPRFGLGPR